MKKLLLSGLFLLSVVFVFARAETNISKISIDSFICDTIKSIDFAIDVNYVGDLIASFDYAGDHEYIIETRTSKDTTWYQDYSSNSHIGNYNGKYAYDFRGVSTCTKYQIRVRTYCYQNGVYTPWATSKWLSIVDCSSPCPKPYIVSTNFYKDTTGLFANISWLNDFGIDHNAVITVTSDDSLFKKTITTKGSTGKIELPLCKKFKISTSFNCGGVISPSVDTLSKPIACPCSKPEYIMPYSGILINRVDTAIQTDVYFSSDKYYPEYKQLINRWCIRCNANSLTIQSKKVLHL